MSLSTRAAVALALVLLAAGCGEDPVRPDGELRFQAVAAGAFHTCALDEQGGAWCWGSDSRGQLGVGGGGRVQESAAAVRGGLRFRAIAAGRQHTCAVDVDGAGWCWGANDAGQLGDGSWTDRDVPRRVRVEAALSDVAAGASHTCATTAAGEVLCWGSATRGQTGSAAAVAIPVVLRGAPAASSVAAGGEHSCALGVAGAYCWGGNEHGQLGSATLQDSRQPVRVSTPTLFHRLAAGSAHACALGQRQEVLCWGDNSAGQLGRPGASSAGTAAPVPLPALAFGLIAAGGNQSCAATASEVWCWGEVVDGRLGGVATVPHVVQALAGPPSDLAVGDRHGCVVVAAAVRCWGDGGSGQLGQGSQATVRSTP